jgi:hypothetical protein
VYVAPNQSQSLVDGGYYPGGVASRYDTKAPFASASSWVAYDQKQAIPGTIGYGGAVFDGRYVYMGPIASPTGASGTAARYDTAGAGFASAASWSSFDMTTLGANVTIFESVTWDGTYVYFVPVREQSSAPAVRYDTRAPFAAATSWAIFDTGTLSTSGTYLGGLFDGRYVYLVPITGGVLERYDTLAPFTATTSWSTFDLTKIDPAATGFQGGAFDGQYVYLTPQNGALLRFQATSAPAPTPPVHGSFL